MVVKSSLKVILAGGRQFGADVLNMLALINGVEVVGVISTDPKIIDIAENKGIKIIDIDNLPEHDIGITAHYFGKIPANALRTARISWIGYHPSLLPLYRGKNAVKACIKDSIVGGTIYVLNDSFDAGEIVAQDWAIREYDDPLQLWINTLAPIGLKLIFNVLGDIKGGKFIKWRQADRLATYC